MAIVGTMGLIGIAINDSIVVLAALSKDKRALAGDRGAISDVVVGNTRHILATTVTTIGGFAPLMIVGGSFWPPVAVSIAGGVAGATVLALFFVPTAFAVRHRERRAPVEAPSQSRMPAAPPPVLASVA